MIIIQPSSFLSFLSCWFSISMKCQAGKTKRNPKLPPAVVRGLVGKEARRSVSWDVGLLCPCQWPTPCLTCWRFSKSGFWRDYYPVTGEEHSRLVKSQETKSSVAIKFKNTDGGESKMFKAACRMLDSVLNGAIQDGHRKQRSFTGPWTNSSHTDIQIRSIRDRAQEQGPSFPSCISTTQYKFEGQECLSNGTDRANSTAFGHQLHQSSTAAASHLSQFVTW